jgi:branched-chain amino acid transport system substrate-binding protein
MNGKDLGGRQLCIRVVAGMLSAVMGLLLSGCAQKEPIRVGFVAELTGRQADLGVQERDAVQLAVEKINAAGGVAGRSIELIVRDDRGTPGGAQAADRELIAARVVATIGHATSGQTIAALPVTDTAGMVLVSPTSSTPKLSGLKDRFFRVCADIAGAARALAQHVYQRRRVTRLAVLYDTDNAPYTESYWTAFAVQYRTEGGDVVGKAAFSSAEQPDFAPLIAGLQKTSAEGFLLIASPLDTALIAQRARLSGWHVPLFTTGWAYTEALIRNGGKAIEGTEIELAYDMSSQSPAFLDFRRGYQVRFGHEPTFAAALGYEALLILAAALEQTGGRAEGLPEALVKTKDLMGLIGTLSLDEYGDIVRASYLGAVRGGRFVTLGVLTPSSP